MKTFNHSKRQKGNYLLNVSLGILLTIFLMIWGIPKIKNYMIEGAIPSVADEIQRFVTRTKSSTYGSGTSPYTGLTQAFFARSVRGSALQVGDVSGQGTASTVVRHGLGGGDDGLVTISTTGDTFSLTFSNVSDAACPGLASALQRTIDGITINGKVSKATNSSNVVTTGFVAGTAAANCTDGDTNAFVFTLNRD